MFISRTHPRTLAAAAAAVVLSLFLAAFPTSAQDDDEEAGADVGRRLQRIMDSISPYRIDAYARFLASDALEGRGTGQRGGEIAADYIASEFQLIGLGKPIPTSAGAASYFQDVPLVGVTTDLATSVVAFANDEETFTPTFLDQSVVWTETQTEAVEVSSNLVFVGYGVYAPEIKWDDFKDVDVTGKILLMLVNDPPSEDPNVFGGPALTYYGRWTYKYWIAAAKGAVGAILIHTPDKAGYGWDVVKNSWGKELSFLPLNPEGTPPLKVAGWVNEEAARKLMTMGGQDLDALVQAAATPDFKPVPMKLDVAARINSKIRQFQTRNVVGFLPGSDPAKQLEFVIFTAHYDHLGIGPEKDGDSIYNGLQDNATGVSALLEIARAFTRRDAKTKRSLLFMATAAEEQGLLGSAYFTDRRHLFIFPGRMAADINIDGISPLGQTTDMVFLGADRSPQLNKLVDEVTGALGITREPDPHPEKGSYYRSDHFNFAKIGVPSVSIKNGLSFKGQPEGWGEQQYDDYLKNRYHQPTDQYDPSQNFEGVARISQVAFYLGYRLGMEDETPMWNPGDEFEEERKEAMTELAEAAAAQKAGAQQQQQQQEQQPEQPQQQ